MEDQHIVRIRGMPYSAGKAELVSFFAMCRVKGGKDGVHITYLSDGRPSGEAFIVFETRNDMEKALNKNREYMGNRYVEIFEAQKSEFDWAAQQQEGPKQGESVIRLRGLPYRCSKDDIQTFFSGLQIADGCILIAKNDDGKDSGDGYVKFVDSENADEAMKLNRERIGHSLYSLHPYAWFTFPGN